MIGDRGSIDRTMAYLAAQLIARRTPAGYWEGRLASSALSTATAVIALTLHHRVSQRDHTGLIDRGVSWLAANQNVDGGWGDTIVSPSNLSTTVLCWSAISLAQEVNQGALSAAERWLRERVEDLRPITLKRAVQDTYGADQTFSAPILTVLALTGTLGRAPEAWRLVPQLPFELAACPHAWFRWLRLPVVSYALPALVAIGHARHEHAPTRLLPLAKLRTGLRPRTLSIARRMQPASGGYLEATPLTAFVVMSLVSSGSAEDAIVDNGVRFLRESARADGSWPIDTNLATWVTTLSFDVLNAGGWLTEEDRERVCEWLLAQQSREVHPFTSATPGGWAWTDLSGGVPDADDTAGALLALTSCSDERATSAAIAGIDWLLGLQNRDGGVPTFCRGWGALPFDRSAPDLTAHALRAWVRWYPAAGPERQRRIAEAGRRAITYLHGLQQEDGSWVPLWFGNEKMPDRTNPTYGTASVVAALAEPMVRDWSNTSRMRQKATSWLLGAQNSDGGWGAGATRSTLEETGLALQALATAPVSPGVSAALMKGARWIVTASDEGRRIEAAPIGLYFARLWYYEELYPLIFALSGLSAARSRLMS